MTGSVDADFALDASTPGSLGVSGVLSFDTAAAALQAIRSALHASAGVKQLDLSGVTRSDSAGLACVVAIVAEASQGVRGQALH
ncbi:MAG: STAS domain-containing protein, partial [Rhodanobacter sp.]